MNSEIKNDIIALLNNSIKAIENKNYSKLRYLSNQTIHNASIYQDENSISIGVVVWCLYKVFKRTDKLSEEILDDLRKAKKELEIENLETYQSFISDILQKIKTEDRRINKYVEEILRQAQIKKGSKIYSHGISIARCAQILDLTIWELANYIGKTNIYEDEEAVDISCKERVEFAQKIFGV
jgi:TRAP-type mannitol/chloroaromatic compound transport system substrate-binding protein